MRFTRREVLRLVASSSLLTVLPGLSGCGDDSEGATTALPEYNYDGPLGPTTLFQHGVASGDPLADAVILWTRVTPASDGEVNVFWEIAEDLLFERRIGAGWSTASPATDYTLKLDVVGLQPAMTYYYRFLSLGRSSMIGRTRTTPRRSVDRLRFAVVSCSSFAHGYFHAYDRIAQRLDLDAVIHLGDYIYEYGSRQYGLIRNYEPAHEIVTLADYRTRYAQYRRDPALQAVHQQHPFIAVWDDHESANNSWRDGAGNHNPSTEGAWADRKAAAQQAYSEWMPIRTATTDRVFRGFQYGDLVDLIMLDTRLWAREEQASSPASPLNFEPDRTLLGADQEEWLKTQLNASTARWRVVGQQVMMGQLKTLGLPNDMGGGNYFNSDQWDGYQAARQRFFDVLRAGSIGNVVVLTGDIHSSWAMDLSDDPNNPDAYDSVTGAGSLAVEFVTPAVTSPGIPNGNQFLRAGLMLENPHMKMIDLERRGYMILDITAERVQSAWFHFDQVDQPQATESFAAAFACFDGENHLVEQDAPAAQPANFSPGAPVDPAVSGFASAGSNRRSRRFIADGGSENPSFRV